jgi:hypothetical protein
LKITGLSLSAVAAAVLTAAVVAAPTFAQAPEGQPGTPPQGQAGGTPQAHRPQPKPTNLKVLPKDLTGEQVHEIMHKWEAMLGAECSTCHAADPNNVGPNGKPRLNFADDSKKEKQTARLMFKMTEDINTNYVSMVENSGDPVTCGTCHRGKVSPEPFVPKPEHEDHDHPAGAPDHDHPTPPSNPGTR